MSGEQKAVTGHGEGVFQGAGGLKLYYRRWLPDSYPPRATLAIVHGPGVHATLYPSVVNHLGSHGYAVYGYEHREHVRAPGQRGYVAEWGQSREDVQFFLHLIAAQAILSGSPNSGSTRGRGTGPGATSRGYPAWYPPDVAEEERPQPQVFSAGTRDFVPPAEAAGTRDFVPPAEAGGPLFLLGNGLGGLIVLTYALHHPEGLRGVVALNPASHPSGGEPFLVRLSRMLSRMWPQPPLATPAGDLAEGLGPHDELSRAQAFQTGEVVGLSTESPATDEQIRTQVGDLSVSHLILHAREEPTFPRRIDYQHVLGELERWLEDHL